MNVFCRDVHFPKNPRESSARQNHPTNEGMSDTDIENKWTR